MGSTEQTSRTDHSVLRDWAGGMLGALRRVSHHSSCRLFTILRKGDGMAVTEADWDTLLILDACRYDTFAAINSLDGSLTQHTSRGSASIEFLRANFDGEQHHDIVYVSANPYISRLADRTFHDVIPVYEQWDDTLQTVPPAVMTEAVRTAHETYPHKRIIGHYMQPHYPFLGETGQRIEHRGYAPDGNYRAMKSFSIWTQLQFGIASASRDDVRTAYRENLQIVLASIEKLLPDIDGKTVITADHGNLIGERLWPLPIRCYGHYEGWGVPELINVPWFEPPFETRRDITADPPVRQTHSPDDDLVTERLRALGYHE